MPYQTSKARRSMKVSNSPYSSPHRPRNKGKTSTVVFKGNVQLRDSLKAKLDALLKPPVPSASSPEPSSSMWMDVDETDSPLAETAPNPLPVQTDQPPVQESTTPSKVDTGTPSKRRILPNAADYRRYRKWTQLIPPLVDDYIRYTNDTIGRIIGPGPDEIMRNGCTCGNQKLKVTSLTCLYVHRE